MKSVGAKKLARGADTNSILAFGLANVGAGFVNIMRMPILLQHLGVGAFGFFMACMTLGPWAVFLLGGSKVQVREYLSPMSSSEQSAVAGYFVRRAARLGIHSSLLILVLGELIVFTFGRDWTSISVLDRYLLPVVIAIPAAAAPLSGTFSGILDAQSRQNLNSVMIFCINLLTFPMTLVGVNAGWTWSSLLFLSMSGFWLPGLANGFFIRFRLRSVETHQYHLPTRAVVLASSQSVGSLLSSGLDQFAVAFSCGAAVNANYAVHTRLMLPLSIPPAALAPSQFKSSAVLRATGRAGDISSYRVKILRKNLTISGLVATSGILWMPFLFQIVSRNRLVFDFKLTLLLVVSNLMATAFATGFHTSMSEKGLKICGWISLIVGAMNCALTFLLAHIFGTYGPAMASIFSYAVGCALWVTVWRRHIV